MPYTQQLKTTTLFEVFNNAIKTAIEEEFNREFEESMEKMKENLNNRKAEVLAHLSLKLMSHVRLQDIGNELIISINKTDLK